MKKIIVFGIGNSSEIIENYIDYFKVEIIGYSDNDNSKIGNIHKKIYIYNPNELSDLEHDYILIAPRGIFHRKAIFNQLIALGICEKKIIDIYDFINPLKMKIKQVNEDTEVLVSGISYFQYGINENLISNCVNIANESQDLYYDYNLMKYLLNYKKLKNLKYVIIGLSYYSFQYDLSKSSCAKRVNLYAELLGDFHNYTGDIEKLLKHKKNIEENSKYIFKKNYEMMSLIIPNGPITTQKLEAYKDLAYIDSNKNYPETVKENEQIFSQYLKLLYEYDIKVIVTVAPTTKYYYSNFSKKLTDEFIVMVKKYQKIYKYQFCDFFQSSEFDIEDFTDISHLNTVGAQKYTKILNNYIK